MAFALLFLYALVIFTVGLMAARHTPDNFYVNNRESGALGVGFSIFVSCVGASATLGVIGMAFAVGTPAFWWLGAGAVGLVLLSLALARKVRASGAYTLPHMVETFLGPSVRPVISVVIVVAWLAILAAQFSALGLILASLTGLPPLPCLLIGLVLVCGHTLGGQSAIMRADYIQALLILSSLAVMLVWLTQHNPSWLQAVKPEVVNASFPPGKLLYFLVVVGANYVVCPMLFGRIFSARDEQSARRGGLVGAAGIALCSALIVAVGLACKGLIPVETSQDEVLTSVLSTVMPHWMQLVVSFALISAIASSADSCLLTAATVLSFDLLGQWRRKASASATTASAMAKPTCRLEASRPASLPLQRKVEAAAACPVGATVQPSPLSLRREWVCVLALGLAGAGLSLWGKSILGFLLMAYGIFACGVVMPVGIGLLLHGKGRIEPRFVHAAVVAGGLLGLAASLGGNTLWSYVGMAVSGALTLSGWRKSAKLKTSTFLQTPSDTAAPHHRV
ncbi:MAG: sodium:solute symporter family protein [Burkholderiales bacterium]|jgi:SSS family solute:Na+ symporter|nr:sodium:solute symporter family protein [Burkholderiales bacterium]